MLEKQMMFIASNWDPSLASSESFYVGILRESVLKFLQKRNNNPIRSWTQLL